jgi:2-hydroxychromene-2-carboxylate isomerase
MASAEFHFDFGSPNAYLSHLVLPEIERRTGGNFVYVPVLLGGVFKLTNNMSPAIANQGIKNKAEYQKLEMRRFIEAHGITAFEWNPHFPVNTLRIMRAAMVAEEEGYLKAYALAVFSHMWAEPKKMDEPDVIKSALDQSGFDGAHLLARAEEPAIKARLIENTEWSVARGSFGSPTFFVGDEMYFGKDRLAEVEAALVAAAKQGDGIGNR